VIPPKSQRRNDTPSDLETKLDRIGALIERFRIDTERFLNGVHDVDAEGLKTRIEARLRDLRAAPAKSPVEAFRLSGLEARFSALAERFSRRLRNQEEGRAPGRTAEIAVRGHDPEAGIVLGRSADPNAVEALFAGLAERGAASKLDLESFRGYLIQQIDQIHRKTGADRVQFRLSHEGGKVKLKARPIDSSRSDE